VFVSAIFNGSREPSAVLQARVKQDTAFSSSLLMLHRQTTPRGSKLIARSPGFSS
jgi:hypothetical protein